MIYLLHLFSPDPFFAKPHFNQMCRSLISLKKISNKKKVSLKLKILSLTFRSGVQQLHNGSYCVHQCFHSKLRNLERLRDLRFNYAILSRHPFNRPKSFL